jgi:hypothetical protein
MSNTSEDLSEAVLTQNHVACMPDGQFHCELCHQQLHGEGRLRAHLRSKHHLRRLGNAEWWEDPLSQIPEPHRTFTKRNEVGWPICTLCNKRMERPHWLSAKHQQWIDQAIKQQQANREEEDLQPPLPQPPPPPTVSELPSSSTTGAGCSREALQSWGSRGPQDEVLNQEEWMSIVQAHDSKYANPDWWPISTEWEFFDV